jgi:hypothetical protein
MPEWFVILSIICLTILMVNFLLVTGFIVVAVVYDLIKERKIRRRK